MNPVNSTDLPVSNVAEESPSAKRWSQSTDRMSSALLTGFWGSAAGASRCPHVVAPASMGGMPCVVDQNENFVPLFHIFAVMEESTDFIEVCDELSDIPASTLDEVVDLIRTVLCANGAGIDVDRLAEQYGYSQELFRQIQGRVEAQKRVEDVASVSSSIAAGPSETPESDYRTERRNKS